MSASNLIALDSYLSINDVIDIVGVRKSTIYRWMEEGSFPRPRQLGANCVRWPASAIKEWQDSLPTTGREPAVALKKMPG
jgi:prophage regulatory protein